MELLKKYASFLDINLSDTQIHSFEIFTEHLMEWNSKFNITRITDPEEIQIKHFLDSITLCRFIPSPVPQPLSLIDVGSGGGFPGIPLKIMMPNIKLTLLEATKKKCDFLTHISGVLNLENVSVINDRAENLSHDYNFRNQFDLVTSRALAKTSTVVELCAGLCSNGGNIIAWKTPNSSHSIDAKRAITQMTSQIEVSEIITHITEIIELEFSQSLIQIPKTHNIGTAYPRKNGFPKKRPL